MTQQEILDYNKRCAEFLTISEEIENELVAYPKQQYSPLCSYANAAYIADKEDNPDNTVWNYCKFYSDWNWIMEVVEAIEKLKTETSSFEFHFQPKSVLIKEERNYSFELGDGGRCSKPLQFNGSNWITGKTKKEAVVQAINQFLIWYNENKRKTI